MKSIKNKLFKTRVCIFIFLLFSLLCCKTMTLVAQQVAGPFNYSPPDYTISWNDDTDSVFASRQVEMSNVPRNPLKNDGVMVAFDMTLASSENNKPIVSFYDRGFGSDPILHIYYSNNSIIIARQPTEWQGNTYHYSCYDKIFDFTTSGNNKFQVKIYITSRFIFFAARVAMTNDNYLSPFFFGLDAKGESVMQKYIQRSSDAFIRVGDYNTSSSYQPYISIVELYSFNYNTLQQELQNNFSSPNSPTSNN
ncbi:MAG: hypothetical protein LBG96_04675 [Tannerella sp.]|nr:hypothetical protein [Tannerella sp.]